MLKLIKKKKKFVDNIRPFRPEPCIYSIESTILHMYVSTLLSLKIGIRVCVYFGGDIKTTRDYLRINERLDSPLNCMWLGSSLSVIQTK